ncbi:MAG: sigma-70 family RNA polymerase sigma factor [Dehalococcoidia bacterium]
MSQREAQILQHMPLVTFVVNRLSADRMNTLGLEREDAIGFGTEGLIQAIDGFDSGRGTSFASFAIQRIRGSILDAVRRQDPLPRSLRRSTRQVEQAGQELATQLGRWPTKKEIAIKLGLTPAEVRDILQHASSRFVSLENVLKDGAGDGNGQRWDPADADERGDPAIAAEHHAALRRLRTAIGSLSERDRAILQLRYAESRPFHEVGRKLGLSESRVCQLHKRILRVLRQQLADTLEEAA